MYHITPASFFNITSNYYQAVLEKERLILFDSNVLLSNERLQVARDKYELGKSSKLDFLQAQVDLNTDKSQRLNQQQVLINTKLELSRLISKEMDEFTLVYNLSENETLILETLLDGVENQNPQLTALKKQELAFKYDERINRGGIFPQVNLFAGYVHARSETPAGFAVNNTSDDITYGLTASWTLFNGFNTTRQIQNAKIQKDVASYQYQDQLISIRTAIRQGFTTYNNSIQLMELEKENLNVARENNEISKERYNIGLATSLELREAQQNFLNAELRFQDAAFNSKIAALELKYLAGISIR